MFIYVSVVAISALLNWSLTNFLKPFDDDFLGNVGLIFFPLVFLVFPLKLNSAVFANNRIKTPQCPIFSTWTFWFPIFSPKKKFIHHCRGNEMSDYSMRKKLSLIDFFGHYHASLHGEICSMHSRLNSKNRSGSCKIEKEILSRYTVRNLHAFFPTEMGFDKRTLLALIL